ncbi:MAG: R3H domain-containing nucleic acid-binding protein [bacterium]
MDSNIVEISIDKTKELLEKLGIAYSDVMGSYDAVDNSVSLQIKGDDIGILIGFHGKNLDSMKVVLSIMINKDLGRDNSVRIYLDINDYSAKRTEQLKSMLENAKSIMETRQKSVYTFPPMSPADRRTIHTLAAEMGIKTESMGEGKDRHVNLIRE